MIVEAFLNIILLLLTPIISVLPVIEIPIPTGLSNWILDIFRMSSMFLPIPTIMTILGLSFVITNFNIIWKLVMKFIKLLPFT